MEPVLQNTIALLDREHAGFIAAFRRVPAARQSTRPEPEVWSAVDVVEHVALANSAIARLIETRAANPQLAPQAELDAAQFTDAHRERLANRDAKVAASEPSRPTGMIGADEALARLDTAHGAVKAALTSTDAALLDGMTHPHRVLGSLTLRGWILFAAHHQARHAAQIDDLATRWAKA